MENSTRQIKLPKNLDVDLEDPKTVTKEGLVNLIKLAANDLRLATEQKLSTRDGYKIVPDLYEWGTSLNTDSVCKGCVAGCLLASRIDGYSNVGNFSRKNLEAVYGADLARKIGLLALFMDDLRTRNRFTNAEKLLKNKGVVIPYGIFSPYVSTNRNYDPSNPLHVINWFEKIVQVNKKKNKRISK